MLRFYVKYGDFLIKSYIFLSFLLNSFIFHSYVYNFVHSDKSSHKKHCKDEHYSKMIIKHIFEQTALEVHNNKNKGK